MIGITIGGLPGSGTTTVAELLEEALDVRYVYTGDIFRKMAKSRGMKLEVFGDYVAEHPDIDRELDRRQVELAEEGDVIIEGRLAGYMAHSHDVRAYKIWLYAPFKVRMERVARRESRDLVKVIRENMRRERGERERYIDIYDFDLEDTSFYDIKIDSSRHLPEEIRDILTEDMRKKGIL